MKKYIIECDRCGREIENDPFTVGLTTKDRESEKPSPDYDATISALDFCENCIGKIKRYVINREFENEVQEMEIKKKSESEKLANIENMGDTENTALAEDEKFTFSAESTDSAPDPFEYEDVRNEMAEIDKIISEVSTPKKKKQRIVKQDGPTKRELVWEMYKKKVKPKDIAEKLRIASGTVSQYIYLCKQQGWK